MNKKILYLLLIISVLSVIIYYVIFKKNKESFVNNTYPYITGSKVKLTVNTNTDPIHIAGIFIYDDTGKSIQLLDANVSMSNKTVIYNGGEKERPLNINKLNLDRTISNMLDGPLVFDQTYDSGNVTHSMGSDKPSMSDNDWWQYNFPTNVNISAIEIYTRTDCCYDRNNKLSIDIINTSNNTKYTTIGPNCNDQTRCSVIVIRVTEDKSTFIETNISTPTIAPTLTQLTPTIAPTLTQSTLSAQTIVPTLTQSTYLEPSTTFYIPTTIQTLSEYTTTTTSPNSLSSYLSATQTLPEYTTTNTLPNIPSTTQTLPEYTTTTSPNSLSSYLSATQTLPEYTTTTLPNIPSTTQNLPEYTTTTTSPNSLSSYLSATQTLPEYTTSSTSYNIPTMQALPEYTTSSSSYNIPTMQTLPEYTTTTTSPNSLSSYNIPTMQTLPEYTTSSSSYNIPTMQTLPAYLEIPNILSPNMTTTAQTVKPTQQNVMNSDVMPTISPSQTIALLNSGLNIDTITSRGMSMNAAYRGPSTNIVQTEFTGTSNIYSPYLYYNKGINEKFNCSSYDKGKQFHAF